MACVSSRSGLGALELFSMGMKVCVAIHPYGIFWNSKKTDVTMQHHQQFLVSCITRWRMSILFGLGNGCEHLLVWQKTCSVLESKPWNISLCRHSQATGTYISRSLSYAGAEFNIVKVDVDPIFKVTLCNHMLLELVSCLACGNTHAYSHVIPQIRACHFWLSNVLLRYGGVLSVQCTHAGCRSGPPCFEIVRRRCQGSAERYRCHDCVQVMYDRSCTFWHMLWNIFNEYNLITNRQWMQFYGTQMRFFRQMLMAAKVGPCTRRDV
jgi:hypothetical protein